MSERVSIRLRDVENYAGKCEVEVGAKSATLNLGVADTVPADLLWAALTALHPRDHWRIAMDFTPDGWMWHFRSVPHQGLVLEIIHLEDDQDKRGVSILNAPIDGEVFAHAVLEEMLRWRDGAGIVAFEVAFNTEFPVRLLAALEAALATKPLPPLHSRIDYTEFLPPE